MVERIRNFQIKDLIATGGMAAVYKAVQVSLDRDVAVKILHQHLAQDEKFIKRFEREAKSAAALKHENIVDIIDYGLEDGKYFIAMEYVDGRSLKSLLEELREIPVGISLKIVSDVLSGLEYAHKKGVIHRDIKPGNILISFEGRAKIADFGLAKAKEQSSLTVTGALIGTPAYMSPEQAVGKKVDQQSDLFSLGIVLYEMLTGSQPFRGETYSGIINEIISKTPRPLSEIKPAIFDVLEGLLNGMLAKDLERRFPDATAVRTSLDQAIKELGIEPSGDAVANFLKDPVRYAQESKKKLADQHLRKGLYLMKLGLDRIDDAIKEFERVLAIDPNNIEAKEKLEQLKKKRKTKLNPLYTIPVLVVAALIAVFVIIKGGRISPGESFSSISIMTNPKGATVYLDGKEIGLSPLVCDSVSPGVHLVEVKREGYIPFLETLKIHPDSTLSMDVALNKEGKPIPEIVVKKPEVKKPTVKKPVRKTGILIIKSKPLATIYINGKRSKAETRLAAGEYEVLVKRPGYQSWKGKALVEVGKRTVKAVVLKPLAGYVKVGSKPWADFFIDGKYVGTTPLNKVFKLKPGPHTFKLANYDYWPWTETMTVKPGETLRIYQVLVTK